MKMPVYNFLLLIFCACSVFGQRPDAREIWETTYQHCSQLQTMVPGLYIQAMNEPKSKLYVIYYEGQYRAQVWNKKLKHFEIEWRAPRRGNAVNRALEVGLILKDYKVIPKNLIYVDGGYREEFMLEFWIVPDGAPPPKPTPTLTEKDFSFDKGKPVRSRYCARIYDGL